MYVCGSEGFYLLYLSGLRNQHQTRACGRFDSRRVELADYIDLIFTTERQRVNNSQKKKIFLVCVMNLLLTVPFTASTTNAMEMNRAMTSSVDLNTLHK